MNARLSMLKPELFNATRLQKYSARNRISSRAETTKMDLYNFSLFVINPLPFPFDLPDAVQRMSEQARHKRQNS